VNPVRECSTEEAPGATLQIPISLYPNCPKSNFVSNMVGERRMKAKNHVKQQKKTILQGAIKQSLWREDVLHSVTNPFNLKLKF